MHSKLTTSVFPSLSTSLFVFSLLLWMAPSKVNEPVNNMTGLSAFPATDGGDFSLTFRAAAPFTYDHTSGGGAWNDGTNGEFADIRPELEGSQFTCGDIVTYLVKIEVGGDSTDSPQSIEFDMSFSANSTGQPGAGHLDALQITSSINYGQVENGDDGTGVNPGEGFFGLDSGISDDRQTVAGGDTGIGGSSAVVSSETYDPPGSSPFDDVNPAEELLVSFIVDDLESGETLIVRIDVSSGCDPGSSPTGNLQASLLDADLLDPNDPNIEIDNINTGNQTINFKKVGDLFGAGEPVAELTKKVTTGNGDCASAVESLNVLVGEDVKYCYTLSNPGTFPLLNVVLTDDNSTPGNPADDFTVSLSGLTDEDNDGMADDLAAGATATGEAVVTISSPGTFVNTATASGEDDAQDPLSDSDDATVTATGVPQVLIEKTVVASGGACPGVESLNVSVGDQVKYCYSVSNPGSAALLNVVVQDDNATPGNPADDFFISLTGLTDEDNDGNADDLAAGAAATGESGLISITSNGVKTNIAIASGVDENGNPLIDTDDATVNSTCDLTITSIIPTIITCVQDGSVDLSYTGGTPPITFSWTGPGGFTAGTEDLSGLTVSGTYNVTVSDANGCTSTDMATVTKDGTPPAITCPGKLTINCGDPIPSPYATVAAFEAADAFSDIEDTYVSDADITLTSSDGPLTGNQCDGWSLERTYTAEDPCGNSASCVQAIHIGPAPAPAFVSPPADATVDCAAPAPAGTPLVYSNGIIDLRLNAGGSTVADWDADGAPFLSDPGSNNTFSTATSISLDPSVPAGTPLSVFQTERWDNIGGSEMQYAFPGIDPGSQVTVRLYLAEIFAGGGGAGLRVFDVALEGAVPPAFNDIDQWAIANSLNGGAGGLYYGFVLETSVLVNDGELNLTFVHNIENPAIKGIEVLSRDNQLLCSVYGSAPSQLTFDAAAGCLGAYEESWSASVCNFNLSESRTITVIDGEDPMITSCPGPATVSCFDSIDPADLGQPAVSDNCDVDPTVTYQDDAMPDFCNGNTITRTWTVTDDCSNSSTCTQTITVLPDTEAPMLQGLPADLQLSLECTQPIPPAPTVTATDNCDPQVTVTFSQNTTPGDCAQEYTITRTWSATDACGNPASATQTIQVVDTQAPQITCPPDLTVECDQLNECITFTQFTNGSIVSMVSTSIGDVSVLGVNPNLPGSNAAMIFNSAAPSTADLDLGSPNQDFGGPGIGTGGAAGEKFQNDATLGNLLIISADLNSAMPDDEADGGTEILLEFPQPVTLEHMNVVDIDPNQTNAEVRLYGPGNVLLATIPLAISDDNGLQLVNLGPTAGVTKLVFSPDGSGGIDNICYTTGTPFGFATATDLCDQEELGFSFTDVVTPGACPQEYSITRTWTVRDDCDNSETCTQTINIVDSTPPLISPQASDLTVECDGTGNLTALANWLSTRGGASASDNCGTVTWSNNFNGLSDDCGTTGSATVTFTARDECGNTSSTTATFTIEDTTDPYWVNMPSDLTVECDGAGNTAELNAWLTSFTADDQCGSATVTNDFTALSDDCGATGSATVEFTATDECGNDIMKSATFTIEDTTDPYWVNMPSDLTVECDGAGNTAELNAWLTSFTADDQCGSATVTNDFTALSDDCGATGSATVEFTATDECGNDITKSATFTIEDTTDPYWVNMPSDLTVECDGAGNTAELNAWLTSFTADDQCGSATVTNDFTALSDDCGATGSATVEFTATDECGNDITKSATFTIEDTTDPYWVNMPSDLTVECDGAGNTAELNAWLTSFTADDQCGSATVTNDFTALSDDCGATGSATVEFTATDECGNDIMKSATFTIEDTTDPYWVNMPSDLTVECDGAGNTADLNAWLTSFTADDQCGSATVTNDFTALSDDCGATGSATVEFTATDECGNDITKSATFTIEDTTDPYWVNMPSDLTVECDGAGNTADLNAWLTSFTADDQCGSATVTNDFTALSDDCGATGSATVEFTATDECGNDITKSATFTIEDTTDPYWVNMPSDLTVECDGAGNTADLNAWLTSFTADDQCGSATVTNDFTALSDDCGATGSATVEFTATDECGNDITKSATFTIEDTTDPYWVNMPSDLTVECDGAGNTADLNAWLTSFTADDQCGSATVTNDFTALSDDCGATGSATVEFTATDECGNDIMKSATFTIEDTTDPYWVNMPSDLTVECDGAGNTADLNAWLTSFTADDQCGSATVTNDFTALSDDCGATGSATVEFTATDECGNDIMKSATFTIEDTTDPYWVNMPSDLTVECDGAGNTADLNAWLTSFTADDQCGSATVTNDFTALSDDCGATGSATVEFTATDECGNDITKSATFTIEDTTDPYWVNMPSDLTVECDGAGNTADLNAWLTSFTADDQCGSATVTNDFTALSDDCGATGSATVEFTATDECGNDIMKSATFTIEDTTDPYWVNMPSDLTVECDGAGNTADLNAWLTSFTADDQCGSATVTNDFTALSDDCGATGSATVEFTATDECGNDIMKSATFTIEDTTDPYWVNMPSDLTVECDGAGNTAELNAWLTSFTADDQCGSATVTNDFTALSDDCGATGSATVEFTATDECGNDITKSATFTIEDTTDPYWVNMPSDLTVECDGAGNTAELNAWLTSFTADDQCGSATVTNDFTALSDDCGATGSATVEFTATDECGNDITKSATFTIEDTTDPTLDMEASNVIVECDGAGNTAELNAWLASNGGAAASDVCSGVTWSNNFTSLSDGCGATGNATVTFTATDACGNSVSTIAKFVIVDTQAPQGTCPQGLTGLTSLDDVPDPDPAGVAAVYTDECSSVSAVLVNSWTAGTDCGTFNVNYIYEVSDECGNTVQCQVVHSGNNPNQLTGTCPEGNKKLICFDEVPAPDEDWVASHYSGNGPVTATLVNIIEMGDVCSGFTVIHEYEVTDGCATLTCKVRWEGIDNHRPTGNCPDGLTDLICVSDIPDPDPAGVAAHYSDGCGPVTAVLLETIDDTDNCTNFSRSYVYEITDPCGNAVSCTVTHSGGSKDCPDCDAGSGGDTGDDTGDAPNDGPGRPGPGRITAPGGTLGTGNMHLFPNPTRGELNIRLKEPAASQSDIYLTIIDIYGRKVYDAKIDRADFTGLIQLNLDELGVETGTYVVNVRTDHTTYSNRFIINRF